LGQVKKKVKLPRFQGESQFIANRGKKMTQKAKKRGFKSREKRGDGQKGG